MIFGPHVESLYISCYKVVLISEFFLKYLLDDSLHSPTSFLLILKVDLCAAGFKTESKEAEFNLSLALRSLQTNLDQDLSNARCNSIHLDFDLHFI